MADQSLEQDAWRQQRRNQLLGSCHFLRTLIATPGREGRAEDLKKHGEKIAAEFEAKFGSDWRHIILVPSVMTGVNLDIINPQKSEEEILGLYNSLLFVGWELETLILT